MAALISIAPATAAFGDAGDIGGSPIHEELDYFSGAGFSAEVYSYVYSGVGSALPTDPVLTPLIEGETLFAYVVRNTGSTGDVDLLGLLNPAGINPHSIGISSVVPEEWDPDYRVNPSLYEGSVQLVQYQWNDGFGGLLNPGDWALVFYRVIGNWEPVDAFVGIGIDLDSEQIPGPSLIPEPTALALLAMGLLVYWRRRGTR